MDEEARVRALEALDQRDAASPAVVVQVGEGFVLGLGARCGEWVEE